MNDSNSLNSTSPVRITGGCQCGAVRYALSAVPDNVAICHCRMCQKATGTYFGAFAGVPIDKIEWTREAPAIFKSSSVVERGFCAKCGTPLTFRYTDKPRISVSLGSLDRPADIRPNYQYGIEGRVPFFAELCALPGTVTEEDVPPERMKALKSLQHPDHDTAETR